MTLTLARRRPPPRPTAVILAAAVLATLIGTLLVPSGAIRSVGDLLAGLALLSMIVATAVVGLLVAWHQPGNPIGWLLLAASLLFPIGLNAANYSAFYVSLGARWAGPAAFLPEPLGISPIVLFPLVLLLFPDGHLPSRRWRWIVWAAAGAGLLSLGEGDAEIIGAAARHQFRITTQGTLAIQAWVPAWVHDTLPLLVLLTLAVTWLAAIGRQVASWRRSSGERRQQLKWLMSGGVVFGAAVMPMLAFSSVLWELAAVAFAALPISIGVAILKYRLYDIDRIISRTLAYALVTGLLVGVYGGLVLLATQVLRFSSTGAVAASTLAAAALFSPVRRRVQRAVDRRFNRARYDADTLVAAFSGRLKDAVDLAAVQADLIGVTHRALEPAHVTVWLRDGAR
jgi:NADH:ubiquinone oxidoreductase subunit K